ncbi:glycosyltransferase family 2 protein [Campylobacter sp. VTCC 70190]|uniref:glycosyltransferase family 2 protein n=1 Tax=Campylobacter sp. VTCC 70190 TaxID=3392118 RepID=UPI00398F67DE
MPIISVIIPIYNVAPYLKECLDSVINQSYRNLDIILVDDGSTDESLDIALEYLNKDNRIFLISKQNGGLSSARNMGLEFIKGTKLRAFFEDKQEQNIMSFSATHTFETNTQTIKQELIKSSFTQIQKGYIRTNIENINDFIIQKLPNSIIHFLDSDDYFKPSCIERCVNEMTKRNLDICIHDLEEYYESDKKFVKKDFFEKICDNEFYKPLDLLKLNKRYNFYFAWQGAFKADILNKYNLRFTQGIYHEDHDFGTILFCLANKMFYMKESLMIYRIRQGSITNFTDKKILPKHLESLEKYFDDYMELRNYFKVYCDIAIAKKIQNFNKNINNSFLKKSIKRYYMRYFDINISKDPLNLNKEIQVFVKNLKYYKVYMKLRKYIRHPKKIFAKF